MIRAAFRNWVPGPGSSLDAYRSGGVGFRVAKTLCTTYQQFAFATLYQYDYRFGDLDRGHRGRHLFESLPAEI
jgi:hypothetical protein